MEDISEKICLYCYLIGSILFVLGALSYIIQFLYHCNYEIYGLLLYFIGSVLFIIGSITPIISHGNKATK